MIARSETAAATRAALLGAAGALLNAGGPEAVTLREVGARAGVSRSAPYRHFADKESLLTELATDAWSEVGDALHELTAGSAASPEQALRKAVVSMTTLGRSQPHLYRLMFTTPTADPTAAVRAAARAHDLFLQLVACVVGPDRAGPYGALLFTSAHGITGLQVSGHLSWNKWHADAESLIDLQISLLPRTEAIRVPDDGTR